MRDAKTEADEIRLFRQLSDRGLLQAALEAAVRDPEALERIAARSYDEDGIMTRIILLDTGDFQLRLHRWQELSADESIWHSHQFPMLVHCFAGAGYDQELGHAFPDPDGAGRFTAATRRPTPGGGFETYALPDVPLFSVDAAPMSVRPGSLYAMPTDLLHHIEQVASADATFTAVFRGRRRQPRPLFLFAGRMPADALQRLRPPVAPRVVAAAVRAALARLEDAGKA